jgi:hypothetical protein
VGADQKYPNGEISMYCKHCGNELPEIAKFCFLCGESIFDESPKRTIHFVTLPAEDTSYHHQKKCWYYELRTNDDALAKKAFDEISDRIKKSKDLTIIKDGSVWSLCLESGWSEYKYSGIIRDYTNYFREYLTMQGYVEESHRKFVCKL